MKIKKISNKKKKIYQFKKRRKTKPKKISLIIKPLIIIFIFLFIKYLNIKEDSKIFLQNNSIKNNSLENNSSYNNLTHTYFIQNQTKLKNISNFQYNYCFCVMGKMENRYTRELISYYMSIGVDKFVIADNNLPNTEKFSDVVQDYIKNNTVDIIDIIGKSYDYSEYYEIMYEKYQDKCEWLLFFDFDEYLRMHFEEGKNIGLKEYLSNNTFDKCEAIVFNWLMYDDNNLLYYDNRTSLERFPNPVYKHPDNKYVKTMVRGKINKKVFTAYASCHCPNEEVITCDSMGKIHNHLTDNIIPPLFKYAYLMHFNTRTAEEFVGKAKRGYAGNRYPDFEGRVEKFFWSNKYTEEKLKLFEKNFNRSFDSIRRIYNKKSINKA